MGIVLETVEWLIMLGFGALVGGIAGVAVLNRVSVAFADARVLLLTLFVFAGMFTTGSVFALAGGE